MAQSTEPPDDPEVRRQSRQELLWKVYRLSVSPVEQDALDARWPGPHDTDIDTALTELIYFVQDDEVADVALAFEWVVRSAHLTVSDEVKEAALALITRVRPNLGSRSLGTVPSGEYWTIDLTKNVAPKDGDITRSEVVVEITRHNPVSTVPVFDILKGTLEKKLDPVGWKELSSAFAEVYEARRVNQLPVYGADEVPEPTNPQQSPGGRDWDGLLYERVEVGLAAEFQNLLLVDYQRTSALLQARYNLCRCIESKGWFADPAIGGIDVDNGFLKLEPAGPNIAKLTGNKNIRFSDEQAYLNEFAGLFLQFWYAQMAYGGAWAGIP